MANRLPIFQTGGAFREFSAANSDTIAGSLITKAAAGVLGVVMAATGLTVDTSGNLSVTFGTTAGTVCQGNDSRLSDPRAPTAHTHASITNTGLAPTAASAPSVWASPGLDVRRATNTGSYPSAYGNILSLNGDGYGQIMIGMNTGASPSNTGLWFRNSRDVVDSFSSWARVLDTAMDAAAISNWNAAFSWGNHASAGYQSALGFTPVQQGGGTSQTTNKLYIGWSAGAALRLQVDSTDFGSTWPIAISGASADSAKLGGQLPNYYATAANLANYLSLSGGTMSGQIRSTAPFAGNGQIDIGSINQAAYIVLRRGSDGGAAASIGYGSATSNGSDFSIYSGGGAGIIKLAVNAGTALTIGTDRSATFAAGISGTTASFIATGSTVPVGVMALSEYQTGNPASGNGVMLDFGLSNNGLAPTARGRISVVNTSYKSQADMVFYNAKSDALVEALRLRGSDNVAVFATRPTFAGNLAWDSGNLTGDQTAHYHSADRAWANITGVPDNVQNPQNYYLPLTGGMMGLGAQITLQRDVAPSATPTNDSFLQAPLVITRQTSASSTNVAGIGFRNNGSGHAVCSLFYLDPVDGQFKQNTGMGVTNTFWHTGTLTPAAIGAAPASHTHAWTSGLTGVPTGLAEVTQPQAHGNIKLGATIVGSWHGIEWSDPDRRRLLISGGASSDFGFYDNGGWRLKWTAAGALVTGTVPWANLTSVPSTFTPSAHTQAWSTITSVPFKFQDYTGGTSYEGFYPSGATPSAENFAVLWKKDGADVLLSASDGLYLQTIGAGGSRESRLVITDSAITAYVTINGTSGTFTTLTAGNARIQSFPYPSGLAEFSHSTMAGSNGYGVLHGLDGELYLNAASGKGVHIRNNNAGYQTYTDLALFTSSLGSINVPLDVNNALQCKAATTVFGVFECKVNATIGGNLTLAPYVSVTSTGTTLPAGTVDGQIIVIKGASPTSAALVSAGATSPYRYRNAAGATVLVTSASSDSVKYDAYVKMAIAVWNTVNGSWTLFTV